MHDKRMASLAAKGSVSDREANVFPKNLNIRPRDGR